MAGEKQTRIGLVLNGGLSLAVWMGGVVHEIDLLRRASRQVVGLDDGGPVAEYDAPIFEMWKEFCTHHDVGRVIVDVVAGTSAGGLNGTLLATAIGRGGVLDPSRAGGEGPRLREMWDRSADLAEGRLLRRPADPRLPSALDGEFFQQTVVEELARLGPPDDGGDRDAHEPVTLFMTATALGTSNTRYTDSFGHDFDVADHRRLYRFHKSERGACSFAPHDGPPDARWFPSEQVDHFAVSEVADPDAPLPIDALSRVARATASFPIVFAPVEETEDVVAHRIVPPAEAATEPGTRWLVDGGVLDNSPFGPVLDAITSRRVRGEVERLLVYVVPSEGVRVVDATPRDAAVARAAAHHDRWPSIITKAVSLPGEADLRGDIETTRQLVARAEGANAGPEALFADSIRGVTMLDGAASPDLPTRRRCGTGDTPIEATAAGLLEQYRLARTVGGLRDVRTELGAAHPGRSMVLLPGRDDEARTLLEKHRPVWVPPPNGDLAPDADDVGGWCWGLAAAERVARYMLRDLRSRPPDEIDQDVRDALATISLAQLRIGAVREAVSDHLRRLDGADLVREGYDEDVALIDKVGESFRELRVTEALLWCVQEAAGAYASAVRNVNPADVVCIGLAVEVSSQAFTAYQPSERTPPFKLLRLGPDIDTPACDRVNAEALNGTTWDRKLYGARMSHFGAFGLPEWRRWDWMCGRLDAQVHLARALAAGSRDGSAVEDLIVKLQLATLDCERKLSAERFKEKRDALISRGDAEVLAELNTVQGGGDLVAGVVDAAVRALPHPLALPGVGSILNSLFARTPEERWRPWWVSPARLVTRWWLKRRLHRLSTSRSR